MYSIPHAFAIRDLNVSDRYFPNQVDLTQWPHLAHLELSNIPLDVPKVSVLIGQDVPQAHIVLDYRWGNQNQPYAMRTPFGCCVAGPTNKGGDNSKPVALFFI